MVLIETGMDSFYYDSRHEEQRMRLYQCLITMLSNTNMLIFALMRSSVVVTLGNSGEQGETKLPVGCNCVCH